MSRQPLRALRLLEALLDERNVTRAAERLHLSQPAASAALAEWRALFKDPLLVRQGRELVPSNRALELQPRLGEAIASLERLLGGDDPLNPAAIDRQFRVAVSDAVGQTLMPPLIADLARVAPGLKLRISSADAQLPEAALGRGALDLVVAHHDTIAPDLRATTLAAHRLVAIVRRGHPAASGRMTARRFADIAQVTIFPHAAALDDALTRIYEAARRPFRLLASTQDLSAAAAIVARTDGLALVSEPMAVVHARTWDLETLALPAAFALPPVVVRAVWHERAQNDAVAAWLRSRLRALARPAART